MMDEVPNRTQFKEWIHYVTHTKHPYKALLYGGQYITVYKVSLFLISQNNYQINFDSDCEMDNFVPIFFFS